MATKVRVPVDVYLEMPEGDGPYHEYVDGEVIRKAMPDAAHMLLVNVLAFAITQYCMRFGGISGGEGRTQFSKPDGDPDYRLPDYAYWSEDQARTISVRERLYMLPPTLAVEVRSPDDTMRNQREKCLFYRRHGVPVCWLVDPLSMTVEVYEGQPDTGSRILRAGDVLEPEWLPEFSFPVADLFQSLDRLRPQGPD